MSVTAKNQEKLYKKVADAIHMSKPTADHVMVVRDANGRWIF